MPSRHHSLGNIQGNFDIIYLKCWLIVVEWKTLFSSSLEVWRKICTQITLSHSVLCMVLPEMSKFWFFNVLLELGERADIFLIFTVMKLNFLLIEKNNNNQLPNCPRHRNWCSLADGSIKNSQWDRTVRKVELINRKVKPWILIFIYIHISIYINS